MTTNRARGDAFRLARLAMGKTQKEIAGAARVSDRTVIRAEQGNDVSTDSFLSLCSVLDIDPRNWAEGAEEVAAKSPEEPRGHPSLHPSIVRLGRKVAELPVALHTAVAAILVLAIPVPYYVGLSDRADFIQPLAMEAIQMAGVVHFGRSLIFAADDLLQDRSSDDRIREAFDILPHVYRCDLQTTTMKLALAACPGAEAELRVIGTSKQGFRIAVGPLSKSVFDSMVAAIPVDPELTITVSVLPDPEGIGKATWIDPVGRRSSVLENTGDGDWMGVDVVRKENRL